MCLIMTTIAAAVTGGVWFVLSRRGRATKSLSFTALMFLSAALMWCVDGIASVLDGGEFFDLTAQDAILGVMILALGFLIFGVLSVLEKAKSKRNSAA